MTRGRSRSRWLAVGPVLVLELGQPRDRRRPRLGPRGDDDGPPRLVDVVAHHHAPRAVETAPAAHEPPALAHEAVDGHLVVPVVGGLVADAPRHRRPVGGDRRRTRPCPGRGAPRPAGWRPGSSSSTGRTPSTGTPHRGACPRSRPRRARPRPGARRPPRRRAPSRAPPRPPADHVSQLLGPNLPGPSPVPGGGRDTSERQSPGPFASSRRGAPGAKLASCADRRGGARSPRRGAVPGAPGPHHAWAGSPSPSGRCPPSSPSTTACSRARSSSARGRAPTCTRASANTVVAFEVDDVDAAWTIGMERAGGGGGPRAPGRRGHRTGPRSGPQPVGARRGRPRHLDPPRHSCRVGVSPRRRLTA